MLVSVSMVIYVTVTLMLKGEINAADFSLEHEDKTTTFSSFIELSSSKLKVGSTLSDTWCICRVIQVETADFKIQKGRSRTRRGSSENVLEVHL